MKKRSSSVRLVSWIGAAVAAFVIGLILTWQPDASDLRIGDPSPGFGPAQEGGAAESAFTAYKPVRAVEGGIRLLVRSEEGSSVTRCEVEVRSSLTGQGDSFAAVTDENGEAILVLPSDLETAWLYATHEEYCPELVSPGDEEWRRALSSRSTERTYEIMLRRFSDMSIRVADVLGRGVYGAKVEVIGRWGQECRALGPEPLQRLLFQTYSTDQSGRISAEIPPHEVTRLRVSAEGFFPLERAVTEDDLDEGKLTLELQAMLVAAIRLDRESSALWVHDPVPESTGINVMTERLNFARELMQPVLEEVVHEPDQVRWFFAAELNPEHYPVTSGLVVWTSLNEKSKPYKLIYKHADEFRDSDVVNIHSSSEESVAVTVHVSCASRTISASLWDWWIVDREKGAFTFSSRDRRELPDGSVELDFLVYPGIYNLIPAALYTVRKAVAPIEIDVRSGSTEFWVTAEMPDGCGSIVMKAQDEFGRLIRNFNWFVKSEVASGGGPSERFEEWPEYIGKPGAVRVMASAFGYEDSSWVDATIEDGERVTVILTLASGSERRLDGFTEYVQNN